MSEARLASYSAAALFAGAGLIALANSLASGVLGAGGVHVRTLQLCAGVCIVTALCAWGLGRRRFPLGLRIGVALWALVLVAWSGVVARYAATAQAEIVFPVFLTMVLVWLGLTSARGVAAAFAPISILTSVLVVAAVPHARVAVSSSVIVVVISVMLAETIAWAVYELRCRENQLTVLATTDPLTGLLNRSAFRSQLMECCRRRDHLMLAFVDLNGFKDINDTYGHQAGDAVLTEVASRLRTIARERDILGRFGGDEFVVLFRLPDPDVDEHALVERIRRALALPWPMIAPAAVTASVGVVEDRAGTRAPDDLLREADTAMYARKHGTTAEGAPEMMASRSLSYYRAAMDGLGGTFSVLRAIRGGQETDWQIIEVNAPVRAYYESNCGEQVGMRLSASDRYFDYSAMREIYTRALETRRPQRTQIALDRPGGASESRRLVVVPIDSDVVAAMTFGISTDTTTHSNAPRRDQHNAAPSMSARSTALL